MDFRLDNIVLDPQYDDLEYLLRHNIDRRTREVAVHECLSQRIGLEDFYAACLQLPTVKIANGGAAAKAAIEGARDECFAILNSIGLQGIQSVDFEAATIYIPNPPHHRDITRVILRDAHGSTRRWREAWVVNGIPFDFSVQMAVDGVVF